VDTLTISNNYAVVAPNFPPHRGPPLYPAIAIPVLNKETYECPPAHVAALERLIPEVTKVVTIGWRGSEQHFQQMLRRLRAIKLLTVAGTAVEGEKILDRLRLLGMPIIGAGTLPGFSSVLADRALDAVLASP
jgi:hypothetical protein